MIGTTPGDLPPLELSQEEMAEQLARPIRFQRKPYDTPELAEARDEAWERFVEQNQ